MKPLYGYSGKQHKLFRVIACMMLVATLLILSGCSSLTYKLHHEKVQQHMEAYLKDRYGTDFDVKPYLFESAFWSNNSHWEAEAYPAGQPEMKFKVKAGSDDNKYTDNYLDIKWSYQAKQQIEKKLREVYGEKADFSISKYELGLNNRDAFKDLDYPQVFEKNHGQGVIHLEYAIFMDGANLNKAAEAEKAYAILKRFILEVAPNNYIFMVNFIDKADKEQYLSNPNSSYTAENNYHEIKYFGSLTIHSAIDQATDRINSSSDLIKFF